MALTPFIRASQGGAMTAAGLTSADLRVSQGVALVVANFPTPFIQASQAGGFVAADLVSQDMRVSQASVMVVARGRVYNPKLRAWRYTQDAHDFYVLRLGDSATLSYDLDTRQWHRRTSGDLPFWRANTGMNWYSAGSIPNTHGSNVICGDDTFGHLWVLDPEQGYDDEARAPPGTPQRFQRAATGQVISRMGAHLPVYEAYLTASFGDPVLTGDTVTLEYSDDLGNSYVSAGALSVVSGNYSQRISWRGLGSITQAGRLFRIVDDGAFARIDGLDCRIGGA